MEDAPSVGRMDGSTLYPIIIIIIISITRGCGALRHCEMRSRMTGIWPNERRRLRRARKCNDDYYDGRGDKNDRAKANESTLWFERL